MIRVICVTMLMGLSTAHAGKVDDQFGNGPLGLAWGAPLEVVQAKHPGGLTWRSQEAHGTFFVYEVDLNAKSFGLEDQNVHTHFEFGKDERLRKVSLMFDYDRRDDVLYKLGELLGQDYLPTSTDNGTRYAWRAKNGLSVALNIGKTRKLGWVVLHVDAIDYLEMMLGTPPSRP